MTPGSTSETESLSDLDIRVFMAIHHALSGVMWLMVVLSAIGGGWGALLVVPLFASPRTRSFARSLSMVLLTTAVLVYSIKRLVARVRPCNCLADIRVVNPPTDFSFPSGHSAGSFAFLVFVALVLLKTMGPHTSARERLGRQLAAVLAVVLAVLVGLSRIALGVHFPGDVLAGAILGTMIAAVGTQLHLGRLRRAREAERSRDDTAEAARTSTESKL
jgi:undecaprenyl-diphosphatase